jgi:hypothetical protein
MSAAKSKKLTELINREAPSDEIRHLKKEATRLRELLRERQNDTGLISNAMTDILEAVPLAEPPKMKFHPSDNQAGSPVVHVAHATDWHIGEVVNPDHIEEFGVANYAEAVRKVGRFAECIVNKTTTARNSQIVDNCHVLGTADWISGGIHEELIRTNEFPEPVQAVKAGFLLGSFLASLAPHFAHVDVDLITAGNHDRLTRKPQSADGGLNSWGYVVCSIAKQYVCAIENIRIKIHSSLSAIVEIAGTRYLITHGDGILGTWGIPFYGIERKKQREAMARMNMPESKHFDKIVIGHFHSAVNHEHWMIGGSLTGTTEHDHKQGRHSRPHQTSWLVHPKHGETDFSRWWL